LRSEIDSLLELTHDLYEIIRRFRILEERGAYDEVATRFFGDRLRGCSAALGDEEGRNKG
jgi:hypothetical protein